MAITGTAVEQYDERGHTYAEDGTITAVRVFNVTLDLSGATGSELAAGAFDVAAEAACPVVRYDSYPGFAYCLARGFTVKNNGGAHMWRCTANYTTSTRELAKNAVVTSDGLGAASAGSASSQQAGNDSTKPADARPYEIKTVKRTVQEVLEFDAVTGFEVRNSAGDLFDPPAEVERTYLGYQVKWYVSPANLRWASDASPGRPAYLDTVNDRNFKIWGRTCAAGSLRVSDLQCAMVWDKIDVSGSTVLSLMYELTAELLHKPSGWTKKILDQGWRCRPGFGLAAQPATDNGQVTTAPVPLRPTGERANRLTDGLHYIEVNQYVPMNLRNLFL